MKHSVKVYLLLLLVLVAVLVFAACGDDETTALTTGGTPDSDSPTVSTTDGATSEIPICAEHTLSANGTYCTVCYTVMKTNEGAYNNMIYFNCDNETLTKAYQIALSDINGNIKNYKAGVLTASVRCLMAGGDYDTPWTRDAAINVWNGFALLNPEVSKNTLLSVLKKSGARYYIDGQYWDAIIWSIGAYQYVNVTHDTEFAVIAQDAIANSMAKYEREEFDETDGLFRGAAVYGDGIAAYPDKYAVGAPNASVMSWLSNPNNTEKGKYPGGGVPMKALSTNCTYYQAYVILAQFNAMLGKDTAEPLQRRRL